MTRKQTRLTIILASLAVLGSAAGLILYAIRDTIVFFYTPSEIAEKHVAPGTRLRLGGLVENNSQSAVTQRHEPAHKHDRCTQPYPCGHGVI